jgi:hypothetical protein
MAAARGTEGALSVLSIAPPHLVVVKRLKFPGLRLLHIVMDTTQGEQQCN